jgi:hypothetical protein
VCCFQLTLFFVAHRLEACPSVSRELISSIHEDILSVQPILPVEVELANQNLARQIRTTDLQMAIVGALPDT